MGHHTAHASRTLRYRLLTLIALIAVLVLPEVQQASSQDPAPSLETRRARVANMLDAGVRDTSAGGLRIVLALEDSNERITLWVDKGLFERTNTGDLFFVRYNPDGTMADFSGPVREE
ncbi:MAG: hypothetical protein AB7K09_21875 [Planctomycetota bacterium]